MIRKIFTRQKGEYSFNVILAITLTLIFVNFSELVEEPRDLIMLPWDRLLLDTETLLELDSFFYINNKAPQTNIQKNNSIEFVNAIYIFVLDVSKSLSESIHKPLWLDKSLTNINNFVDTKYIIKSTEKKAEIFDVAKVRLADMLVSIQSSNSLHNEYFSIWTVGDNGKLVYPNKEDRLKYPSIRKNMAKVEEQYINASIIRVNELEQISDNTDFSSLFDKLMVSYKNQIAYNSNRDESGTLVITILSDLLHDVDNKNEYYGRIAKIKQNWKYLENKISKMSNANIVANMIVVTPTGNIEQIENKQIYAPFKRTFDSYRLTKSKVNESIQNQLLYPLGFPSKAINFYYENNSILNKVKLVALSDMRNLLIEIPSKSNVSDQKDIKIEWSIGGATYNGKVAPIDWGVLSTRGEVFNRHLEQYQTIELKPIIGPNDIYSKTVKVRIVNQDLHRVFHVDINFNKLLPKSIAYIIVIIQLIFLCSLLHLLGCFIALFFIKQEYYRYPGIILDLKNIGVPKETIDYIKNIYIEKNRIDSERPEGRLINYGGANKKESLEKEIIGMWSRSGEIIAFFEEGNLYKIIIGDESKTMLEGSYNIIGHDRIEIAMEKDKSKSLIILESSTVNDKYDKASYHACIKDNQLILDNIRQTFIYHRVSNV